MLELLATCFSISFNKKLAAFSSIFARYLASLGTLWIRKWQSDTSEINFAWQRFSSQREDLCSLCFVLIRFLGSLLVSFCLVFGSFWFFLVLFWFFFGSFLVRFWLVFGSFLVRFWLVFGWFWLVFSLFMGRFWFVFGSFSWFVFGSFLVLFCFRFFFNSFMVRFWFVFTSIMVFGLFFGSF